MKEIALHILDILENSVRAGAGTVELTVDVNRKKDTLDIRIGDDGCGMDQETVKRAADPFYTSRDTRKVGLGLPLFQESARRSGGSMDIQSEPGKGTLIHARYGLSHIDRPPLGDLSETVVAFLTEGRPVRLIFQYIAEGCTFRADTLEIEERLGGIPINEPEVLCWIRDYIREGINSCGGGLE